MRGRSEVGGHGNVWPVVIRGRRRGVDASDQSESNLVAILLSREYQMPKQSSALFFFFPFVIGSWEPRRAGDTDGLFFGGLLFAEPISTPHQRPLQPPSLQPFAAPGQSADSHLLNYHLAERISVPPYQLIVP